MRTLLNILAFSLSDTLRNILRVLISSFGILFLISFLVLYITFRDSVKSYIETNLFGKLSINELLIYPRSGRQNKLFAHSVDITKRIPIRKVKKIRSMKMLKEIYPVIKLDYEARVRGAMMGQARRIHMPVCGISRRFFKGKDPGWYRFRNQHPVPIIAPKAFIDLLNNWFAVIGVPLMDERTLSGFPLQLVITTHRGDADEKKEYRIDASVHAFTDIVSFMGVIAPIDFITHFAAQHRKDSGRVKRGYSYLMMYAKVKDVKNLPLVTKQISRLGMTVESRDDIARRTNEAIEVFDQFSIFVIAIFLIITVISIFNSFLTIVYHRSQKFSLRRVLGVSKMRVLFNFVLEAAFVGLLLGFTGYMIGNYIVHYLSVNIAKWVPALGGLKVSAVREDLLFLSLMFSVIISSISALIPALFAANMNLFKAVRK